MKKTTLFSAIACLGLAACSSQGNEEKQTELGSLQFEHLDSTATPADDFYQFANGTWLKEKQLPDGEARFGSFNEVSDRNREIIKNILNDASTNTYETGTPKRIMGDLYKSFKDTTNRAALGAKPIEADLNTAKALTAADVTSYAAASHLKGIGSFFGMYVGQDLDNNTIYRVSLSQVGLGLPDKEYYFKTDEKSIETRQKYQEHVANMFALVGSKTAAEQAKTVLAVETALAEVSMNATERRDIEKQNNKYTLAELSVLAPNIDWTRYFTEIGAKVELIDTVIVEQPAFFKTLSAWLVTANNTQIQTYAQWDVLNTYAGALSPEFEKTNFDFYGTFLSGIDKQKPFEKRMIDNTGRALGDLLGRLFVEEAFSVEAKEKVSEMVGFMTEVLKERINELAWMSEETRVNALKKVASFKPKLGYPDKWKDFSKLNIVADNLVQNKQEISTFYKRKNINKLGKKIDNSEWGMPAQMVNAYYNPQKNEIVFPAGILQPPFFDPMAEDAVNFARMGAVIGHEMIHGYDDQGAQFDATGAFKNWWTDADRERFNEQTAKLGTLYDSFSPMEGVNVNGQLTMGENIADLGGLKVAYYAYQKALANKERTEINGYTPEQRFFLSFGQIWKSIQTDEYLRKQVATDPHSPTRYRVNGTLKNLPEFYQAFNIKDGDTMFLPESQRALIW